MMLLPVNEIIRNKFLKSFKNNKITLNSRVKQATKDLLSAKIKVDSFDSTHRQICSHKNEILHLTHEIEKKSNSLQISNKCATKIQKVIRGFLTRKKLDNEIIIIRRKICNNKIKDLEKTDLNNLAILGRQAILAGSLLIKFFKRMLFLLKIRRIEKVYKFFQSVKEREAEFKLKIYSKNFFALMKLKEIIFYHHRIERLAIIRKNLALLVIKNYLIDNKLTIKGIRRKIHKYKRMIKAFKSSSAISNRENSTKNTENYLNSSNENIKVEDLGNILECASLTSTEFQMIEQEKQEKIKMSKVSYNVGKSKEPVSVLPYIYERLIKDEIAPPKHHLNLTFCTTARISEASPIRKIKFHYPKNINQPKRLPKIQKPGKRFFTYDVEDPPNYMRSTLCSSLDDRISQINESIPKRNPGPIDLILREGSTLLNQTFAGYQRVNEPKRSISNFRKFDPRQQISVLGQSRIEMKGRAQSSI